MMDLKGLRVVVAGAGAIGSAIALVLARRGAQVTLTDPARVGDNASGVAAGMLAPASEALLDAVSEGHFPLLLRARDAWEGLVQDLAGAPALDRSGAILQVDDPAEYLRKAEAAGMSLVVIDDADARRRAPGLGAHGPFVYTPDDWRLEPQAMLDSLHRGLELLGGQRLRGRALDLEQGGVRLADGGGIAADALIWANGADGPGLTPIKGQILRFSLATSVGGAVVRGGGLYVAPVLGGMIAGATMEAGLSDRSIVPAAVARLHAGAAALFPALAGLKPQAFAGVRAATADGLPVVGSYGMEGVMLARGARRNGWLFAPLIAQTIADQLAGLPPSATAAAFDPGRFR
jgi:glycine oxidase